MVRFECSRTVRFSCWERVQVGTTATLTDDHKVGLLNAPGHYKRAVSVILFWFNRAAPGTGNLRLRLATHVAGGEAKCRTNAVSTSRGFLS